MLPTFRITVCGDRLNVCALLTGDIDGDGIQDSMDNCLYSANSEQVDTDSDSMGDRCDPDIDNDGILNEQDNCPYVVNINQRDSDGKTNLTISTFCGI